MLRHVTGTLGRLSRLLALGGTSAVLAVALAAAPAPAFAHTTAVGALAEVDRAAGHHVVPGPKVEFTTTEGKFTAVLFPKEAPKTVANFVKLVKKHYYDGTVFHRVVPGFMAQGGDPKGTGEGGPGYTIPDELSSTLKHITGSLAMAKTAMPNSAGSQYYITFKPTPFLDGRYTVFGQVIKGMDVVDKLHKTRDEHDQPTGMTPSKVLKARLVP